MPEENNSNQEKNKKEETVTGIVIDALPNTMFKVQLENGDQVLSYLAGKMRMHRIRVMVGDKVNMILDKYGGKARIFKRL